MCRPSPGADEIHLPLLGWSQVQLGSQDDQIADRIENGADHGKNCFDLEEQST
jgi:hypothetical protein